MRGRSPLTFAGVAGLLAVVGMGPSVFADCPGASPGADVFVVDLQSTANYNNDTILGVMYDAFAWGTTSGNTGTAPVSWIQIPNNLHPAIGMNLFKMKNNRFEQIGQSWLKHGFLALNDPLCAGCAGGAGSTLKVGCSDPYTATRNGTQSSAGPKYQVNASTGFFPSGTPANPAWSGNTARRCKVKVSELETTAGGAVFFAEGQYVTQDDATAGNKNNNASYRPVTITGGPNFSAAISGTTVQKLPAIRAWKKADPTVVETDIATGDGLCILSAKVSDNGNGTWHYEYALHNLNSDKSIQSFLVPYAGPMNITNIGFHDVDYNDFDGIPNGATPRNYDGTDWPGTATGSVLVWSTTPYATDVNANAIRWGTLYNFRFDADRAPQTGDVTLGTYKIVGSLTASTLIPGPPPVVCLPDITGDLQVNIDDLLAVINAWGACPPKGACPADVNGSLIVDIDDLLAVINAWGGCP